MNETTTAPAASTPSFAQLEPNALRAFRWLCYGGAATAGLALLFFGIGITQGINGPFAVTAVLLLAATPLLAGAGVIAGLGRRVTR